MHILLAPNNRFVSLCNKMPAAIGILVFMMSLTPIQPAEAYKCPEGMSQLDCRALLYGWTEWIPDNGNTCINGSIGSPAGTAPATTDMKSFVDKYAQAAFNVGKQYGIPYEAILAQGALESGMGGSQLTIQANNFFGIKAGSNWKGPVVYFNTKEQRSDGSEYTVRAAFRAYPNAEAGFAGYGDFITSNSRYKKALNYPTDYASYIREVAAAGYATDVEYTNKVTSLASAISIYIKEKGSPPPSSSLTPTTPTATPSPDAAGGSFTPCSTGGANLNGGSIVSVAQQELALRPIEYDANVLKYSDGNREAWCADFVSWVYKTAGTPFTGGASGGWRQPGVLNLQAWFKANQIYFPVGAQTPQPGDVAFYVGAQTPDGGSNQHVNIVISVDGNTMTTIGGNESNMLKQSTRAIELGSNGLVGFGRMK